eukprot:TRINITY_DN6460_c0_g1_i1.p2 TRINITY_DN6460_c0_g1~~TRINITY_DN6460_c0_g1_i1.p2  ORF type:complete len:56 (-),score=7.13 TRINITY_DN6460_c0_g1_i1:71-238(-)
MDFVAVCSIIHKLLFGCSLEIRRKSSENGDTEFECISAAFKSLGKRQHADVWRKY